MASSEGRYTSPNKLRNCAAAAVAVCIAAVQTAPPQLPPEPDSQETSTVAFTENA
jgi:hypothetical protein